MSVELSQQARYSRCSPYELNNMSARREIPKFHVSVPIKDKPLHSEVDTGSACSLIIEETYDSTWPKSPAKIMEHDLKLDNCYKA